MSTQWHSHSQWLCNCYGTLGFVMTKRVGDFLLRVQHHLALKDWTSLSASVLSYTSRNSFMTASDLSDNFKVSRCKISLLNSSSKCVLTSDQTFTRFSWNLFISLKGVSKEKKLVRKFLSHLISVLCCTLSLVLKHSTLHVFLINIKMVGKTIVHFSGIT